MKSNIKKIFIPVASFIVCVVPVSAQLSKEVVIDRDIEPAMRAVSRPQLVPEMFSSPVQLKALRPWEYTSQGTVAKQLTLLEPAAYADTFAISPYKGYARIGYFPTYNLGVSAGYRFIDNAATKLGAWLNYAGCSYKMDGDRLLIPKDDKVTLTRHTFNLGADLSHHTSQGRLDGDVSFMYASIGQPIYADNFTQSATAFNVGLAWKAATKTIPWNIGASFSTFGFGDDTPGVLDGFPVVDPAVQYKPDAVREYVFGIKGGVLLPKGNHGWGLDVDARFQHLGAVNALMPGVLPGSTTNEVGTYINNEKGVTYGVTRLSPYYHLGKGNFTTRIGVNLDIATKGNSGLYLTPDVTFAFTPSQQFALWARVDGGKCLNTLQSLYDYSPYMLSQLSYRQSAVADASVGVNVGPVYGFTASLWAGYSEAKDWLSAVYVGSANFFASHNTSAFHYGLRLGWQCRQVEVYASAEGAQNGDFDSYYMWRDKARWNINAGIKVTPVRQLDIAVDWKFRSGRHAWRLIPEIVDAQLPWGYWNAEVKTLGVLSDLNASATYRLTDAFSVFANVENILGRRWQTVPGIDNAGVHGLVGVSYKF